MRPQSTCLDATPACCHTSFRLQPRPRSVASSQHRVPCCECGRLDAHAAHVCAHVGIWNAHRLVECAHMGVRNARAGGQNRYNVSGRCLSHASRQGLPCARARGQRVCARACCYIACPCAGWDRPLPAHPRPPAPHLRGCFLVPPQTWRQWRRQGPPPAGRWTHKKSVQQESAGTDHTARKGGGSTMGLTS